MCTWQIFKPDFFEMSIIPFIFYCTIILVKFESWEVENIYRGCKEFIANIISQAYDKFLKVVTLVYQLI